MKNRWFRADKHAKRVSEEWKPLAGFASALQDKLIHFDSIAIVKAIRQNYPVSVCDARDMMVAFVGSYDNDKQSIHFNKQRYDNGCSLWKEYLEKKL